MSKARRHRKSHDSTGRVSAPRRPGGFTLLAALLLCVAGGWAYSTSFDGVFVFDDGPAIVDNPNIKSLWPLSRAMSSPAEVTVAGRPIGSLTLAINYALAPDDARDVMAPGGPTAPPGAAERFARNIRGYHALNLAIHLCAALALFGVVRRTLLHTPVGHPFRGAGLALAIALIWVVHPLHTQSVTYIVQRVESLMGLFYLLTLYCAIRASDVASDFSRTSRASDVASDFSRTLWSLAAIAACALGMATKEVMATAPLVVILWDWTFGVDMRRRLALYAGLAATWIILIALVVAEHRPQSVGFDLGWTPWSYLLTQTAVVTHYLRLAFVPYPLVFDYGWPPARSLAEVWPQALLLTALFAATVYGVVRRHPLGFLGACFFLILAPTSSVLPIVTEVAAEHRMYLPVAAVIAAVVALVGRVLLDPPLRYVFAGAVLAIVVTFAQLTRARNLDYRSEEAIWTDTIAKRPANARARIGYGIDLQSSGRLAEAEQQLRTAVALEASNGRAHMNLGSVLAAQGKLDEGIANLERALALDPRLHEAYGLLGEANIGRGNHALAAKYLLRGVDALPDNPFLLNRAAWLLATSPDDSVRQGAKAVELAERAVRVGGPPKVIFLATLAAAYAETDRFADAADAARRAVALARTQGQTSLAAELEQHVALFSAGRKLRVR